MKWLLIIVGMALPFVDACAQKKQPNGKHTTVVDSINTPPRMDGNTGQFDTVRHPLKKSKGQLSGGKGATYDYRIGTDTIGVNKNPKRRP